MVLFEIGTVIWFSGASYVPEPYVVPVLRSPSPQTKETPTGKNKSKEKEKDKNKAAAVATPDPAQEEVSSFLHSFEWSLVLYFLQLCGAERHVSLFSWR